MLTQTKGFQNVIGYTHLVHRVTGQRNADSIADALGKQRTDAYRGFDNTAVDSACLRNADMQRIITLRCHQTISLQCQRHIMRFE